MTAEYVRFGRSKIHYDIVRSPSRKHTEIVVTNVKKVRVLAPSNKPETEIHEIVKSHSRWIFKKQLNIQRGSKKRLVYSNGATLPYLGKNYRLQIVRNKTCNAFGFQKGKLVANGSALDSVKIKSLYENWLAGRAADIVPPKVEKYCKLMKIDPMNIKVKIKSQQNRIGSLGRGLTLNVNKNIVRLPPAIIDYVIVHELSHIRVPDHSSKYWEVVSLSMPDYEERKNWLELNKLALLS